MVIRSAEIAELFKFRPKHGVPDRSTHASFMIARGRFPRSAYQLTIWIFHISSSTFLSNN
jgi:hypothetical protein